MYKMGDYVVYKMDVCRVVDYKEKYMKNNDYYVLEPVYDNSLVINVPCDSSSIRNVISKEEVEDIINSIPSIEIIDLNDITLENEYKKLLHEGSPLGLVKIIKTTYSRNNDRLNNKRKISEKDDSYFKLAEKFLYGEFAVSLGISYDDAKKYVIDRVDKICN